MRVTIFDCETTDLGGNFGRLICCSFIDLGSDKVETYRRDKRPWKGRSINDDNKLAVAIRDRLHAADIIVGWNSILFDVPFINTRLVAAGEAPIRAQEKNGTQHLDLMYYAGGQAMRLPGRRLDNVARFFKCDNQKTPLTPEVWADASTGDKRATQKVIEHCEADILVTRDVFRHLSPFVKKLTFTLADVHQFVHLIPSRVNQK